MPHTIGRQISPVTGEVMVPVLYLDLDGTVRKGKDELGRFVNKASDVELFPGVAELILKYKQYGWRVVGVTNQGGVALGHMTMEDNLAALRETQRQSGFQFDKIAMCIHHPQADTPEMAICWCRKPKTGMIIETALSMAEQNKGEIYPPHLGVMVGDMDTDRECAMNAGLQFIAASEWRTGSHFGEWFEMYEKDRQKGNS